MPVQANVRVYGVPKGAPGVRVVERTGQNALADPRYGTTGMIGLLQRGPMGLPIPINTQSEYHEIAGDPRDPTWHLYRDGSHLMPDAIDGFYKTGGGAGQLWLIRLDLDGKAKRSEIILKNPVGADALRIRAANEGRWGGQHSQISARPLVYATATTFTLVAPGVEANEFVGAEVEFTNESGKRYQIVANTAAATSGEVVFTIAAQYSLAADSVSGPTTLSGTATYARYESLTGTMSYALLKPLTGATLVNERVITGTGTLFTTELAVGRNLYFNGESRTIDSITSDTTATVSEAFSSSGAGTLSIDNLELVGTGTDFTELTAGDVLYATVAGERQKRYVGAISDATHLTLTSGFTAALTNATLQTDSYRVTGSASQFSSQLQANSSYIVDPNRAGAAVKVVSVVSATEILVDKPFTYSFTNAQLTKQSLSAIVILPQVGNAGLSVEVGQGTKYPQTHFSLNVRFNGSLVYQVADASLDPNDDKGLFVESQVNDDAKNITYRTGAENYQKWITVESLWTSTYTTNQQADVRPCNGSGDILALTPRRLYSAGAFDYAGAIGKLLYPTPYRVARSSVRITDAAAPVALQGSISSLGVNVNGVGTNFRDVLRAGDYLYDPASNSARKIRVVSNQTSLILETAFAVNLPPSSSAKKAGYLEINRGYDLTVLAQPGDRFLVSFPEYLSGGYDGNLAGLIPYYWTKFADVDDNLIVNALWGKNLGLAKLAIPGVSDIVVQKQFAQLAEENALEFRAEIPSNYGSAATAEVFLNQYLGRNDFQGVAFPSYGFVSSPFGSGDRLISLSGEILGGEAARANVAEGYHVPFAGVDAVMARVIKLPVSVKPQDEAVLNLAGIMAVKMMYGNCVVFGARSTALSSLYDFIHIRRIQSNYIRVFLESRELLEQLFKPNQPYLLDQVIMVLNNFARREYRKGVMSQYLSFKQAVEVRGSNTGTGVITDDNTAVGLVEVVNGKLRIYFSYVPTGIVEELSINCGPDILTSQYGNALSGSLL